MENGGQSGQMMRLLMTTFSLEVKEKHMPTSTNYLNKGMLLIANIVQSTRELDKCTIQIVVLNTKIRK